MARTPKPWRRKNRAGWWAWVDGRQILLTLDEDREAANQALYRLLLRDGRRSVAVDPHIDVHAVCQLYLDHVAGTQAPGSYQSVRARLSVVCGSIGSVRLSGLRASHVERFLATKAHRSNSTRRAYLVTFRACLAWARREGIVGTEVDPLEGIRTPPAERRTVTLSIEQRRAIHAAAGPELRDLTTALSETGARPHMLYSLTADHVRWSERIAVVPSKGQPVTLTLTDLMMALLRRLIVKAPRGPLLRDTRGNPWNRNSVRLQFSRLGKRLGIKGLSAYVYRHSFATDALEAGVSPAAVAVLMGHKDLSMIARHYGHLAERRSVIRLAAESAAKASRVGGSFSDAGKDGEPPDEGVPPPADCR